MKTKCFLLSFLLLQLWPSANAQTKGGIINFTMNGFVRGMNLTDSDKPDPDLCFIGSTSTRLGDSLLSAILLTETETALNKFLGYELIPVSRVRKPNIPDEMNGVLVIMETVTEKKAFKELNYDEAITVNCQLSTAGMKTVKGARVYTPAIQLTIKVISKDGKTRIKKNETLKLKDKQLSGQLIEISEEETKMDISLKSLKSATVTSSGNEGVKGVGATELLDWYKQVLDNAMIKE